MNAPPRRRKGQGRKPRTINGVALDVRGGAAFIGVTEKDLYGKVSRRVVPFRKLGGRIIFLRAELEQWLASLPGCTVNEALKNREQRTI